MKGFNFGKLFLIISEASALMLVFLVLVLAMSRTLDTCEVVMGTMFALVAVFLDNLHSDMGWWRE